jgi:hypothetical protein
MTHTETRLKLQEHRRRQPLGEDVGELGGQRDVEDTNISDSDALTDDKVEINLNMLGALMLYDVVTVDQGCPRQGVV